MSGRFLETYSHYNGALPGTVIEGLHSGVWEKGKDYKWYDGESGLCSESNVMCGYPRAVIIECEG